VNENILVARFGTKRCNAKYTLNCPCGFLGAVIYTARFFKKFVSSLHYLSIASSFFTVRVCVRMVAELLFGHQRLPSCSPGASLAFWAAQVGYVVHPG